MELVGLGAAGNVVAARAPVVGVRPGAWVPHAVSRAAEIAAAAAAADNLGNGFTRGR